MHIVPAFDLLPSYGMNGYHTTLFADSVSPSDKDVLLVARKGSGFGCCQTYSGRYENVGNLK